MVGAIPPDPSPFHPGEEAVQTRAGVRARAEQTGRRMVRGFVPEQQKAFFAALPWLVIGTMDLEGRVWATALVDSPGFAFAETPGSFRIQASLFPGDPLTDQLSPGKPMGVLGIEPHTRRRNRLNGVVSAMWPGGWALDVHQCYGNCPQYIQARQPRFFASKPLPRRPEQALLSQEATAQIRRADTFFIASVSADPRSGRPGEGVDVSHRGGRPGFVRVTEAGGRSVLTAPDFAGNNLFNTLGNLAANPRAGLTFIDFATGDMLLLTGEAETIWDGPEVAGFGGALRLLRFTVAEGVCLPRTLPLRWTDPEPAPQLVGTGVWSD